MPISTITISTAGHYPRILTCVGMPVFIGQEEMVWAATAAHPKPKSAPIHGAACVPCQVLVAEWIHFTLVGKILPTIKLKVYTFGGL